MAISILKSFQNASSTALCDTQVTVADERSDVKKKQSPKRTNDDLRTLFVSGLKNSVSKNDMRNYFIGCTKVTVKQNRATPHLKYDIHAIITYHYLSFRYAFVLHRTSREAQRNLQRPINYCLLGPECRLEYAGNRSNNPSNPQSYEGKRILVSGIPENVSTDDLHRLFVNSHAIDYYPPRVTHRTTMMIPANCKTKILLGYDQLALS